MINPFQYGGVVSAEAFCNREQELADLARAAENAERLFVYAERRLGKTSLIKRMLEQLPEETFLPVYVDLWSTDGTDRFVTALAKALTEATSTRIDKLLETAKALFRTLKPSITTDEAGNPTLQFGVVKRDEHQPELEEVLSAPPKIARQQKRRLVIVFDEFQQLLAYDDDLVERSLRSAIQTHEGIAYLFLGSRKHLIQQMFLDANRPLYRAAGHYPLGPIATEHWTPFIRERFEHVEKTISDALIEQLCAFTEGHPFYTQHLAHALWEQTEPGGTVAEEGLDAAVDLLLRRESYAYTTLWESLTKNQQRLLRGLALAPPGTKPLAGAFVQRYKLGSPSSVQRAIQSLITKDIIDRDNGAFVITDRFFKLWIQRM